MVRLHPMQHVDIGICRKVRTNGYPQRMEVGLIGSCTNSSYQDLTRAASLARQVKAKGLKMTAQLIINPGSEQVYCTTKRDGMIADFEAVGGGDYDKRLWSVHRTVEACS